MATVAVPPSPQLVSNMNTRRVPLADVKNATNSPLRAPAVGGKRQRSHASEQRDVPYGQPPSKKLIVEVDDSESRKNGLGRRSNGPPTAFQKKLEAARAVPKQSDRTQRAQAGNLDDIRQWQKHYRKMFPTFVFYFESIPEDMRGKVSRQAQTLGAVRCLVSVKSQLLTWTLERSKVLLARSNPRHHHASDTRRARV